MYHANKDTTLAKSRERYATDAEYRERQCAEARAWARAHRERGRETSAAWRAKNRDKDAAASRKWRSKNPEHSRMLSKARRARVQGARTEPITKGDIAAIKSRQKGKCAVCRERLGKQHIDHIVPLALGGEHAKRNLQLLCPRCNLSKSSKHPNDFMRNRGMLL